MYDLAWEKSWMHKIKEPSVKVQWDYVPRESCRDIYPVIQRKKTDKKSKWCKTFEKYDSAAIWGRLFKIILTLYI